MSAKKQRTVASANTSQPAGVPKRTRARLASRAPQSQLRKLNRTHALLSAVNQDIVRVREMQALFETACRIAVVQGEFHPAVTMRNGTAPATHAA